MGADRESFGAPDVDADIGAEGDRSPPATYGEEYGSGSPRDRRCSVGKEDLHLNSDRLEGSGELCGSRLFVRV